MHDIPRPPLIREASPEEAQALVRSGALLVDVRESHEWERARIEGAELKPMSRIDEWWRDLPKDREVVLYCRSGVRSARIVHALGTQAGLTNIVNLGGGIIAWHDADLPVAFGADLT